ncbi:MAG TPA: ABC transporter permease [Lachnospiraceae bacterium]|nr:ABC transporter permease [Lachnospiraceae bacterium]
MTSSMVLAIRFSALLNALPGNIAQGLIWGIMAIGVYMTFRILDFADLTVDGSLATGGCVCVMLIRAGLSPVLAVLAAFLVGMLCGGITGFLHTGLGIPGILASILTQIGLYSINLNILGQSNQPVAASKYKLLASLAYVNTTNTAVKVIFFAGLALAVFLLILLTYWFFGTEIGHAIRATGSNEQMAKAQGINTNAIKVLTLMISNAFVAMSGALIAQFQGAADVNMARGSIVIGLAAVIIGEVIFGKFCAKRKAAFAFTLGAVVIGAIIYFIVYAIVIWLKLPSEDMKLFSAIIVAIFLAVPHLKEKYGRKGAKANG